MFGKQRLTRWVIARARIGLMFALCVLGALAVAAEPQDQVALNRLKNPAFANLRRALNSPNVMGGNARLVPPSMRWYGIVLKEQNAKGVIAPGGVIRLTWNVKIRVVQGLDNATEAIFDWQSQAPPFFQRGFDVQWFSTEADAKAYAVEQSVKCLQAGFKPDARANPPILHVNPQGR